MHRHILALVCATLALYIIIRAWQTRQEYVSSFGRTWSVLASYANRVDAANMMERLNRDVMHFMWHCKTKYHIDETADAIHSEGDEHVRFLGSLKYDQREILRALLDGYDFEHLYENKPTSSADTSYTVKKGQAMYICLRDGKDPSKLVDYDVLLFVMLHELAHIGNYDSWGHDERFWTIFKFFLQEAEECGIYTPVDYGAESVNYCKLEITYSPYYDTTLTTFYVKGQQ